MGVKKIYVHRFDARTYLLYNSFKQKMGSEHIASPVGIQVLLEIIEEIKPRHILEIGGGLGTLSYAALKFSDVQMDIFEDHPFCIKELQKNLRGYEERYQLLEDYNNFILPHTSYDLIIIDGGGHAFVHEVISKCQHIGRIFIEGGRGEQRKQARMALRQRYIFRPIQYMHSEKKYKGAHQIICRESNSSFFRFLSYWFWEVVIFNEIKQSLTYRLRKILRLSEMGV